MVTAQATTMTGLSTGEAFDDSKFGAAQIVSLSLSGVVVPPNDQPFTVPAFR
jgi:hypothetical protein